MIISLFSTFTPSKISLLAVSVFVMDMHLCVLLDPTQMWVIQTLVVSIPCCACLFFPFESNILLFYFQRLFCECKHNTCGNNCEKCCEFYYQKPWQPGNNGLKCESRLTFDSFIISQESCEMSFLHYKDQLKMRFSKILIYWYLKISFLVKKKSFKKPILYLIDIFKGLKYYR